MPTQSKINNLSGKLANSNTKHYLKTPRYASKKELKLLFDIPNHNIQTENEKKIYHLEEEISELKGENSELRMLVNQLLEMGLDLNSIN